MTYGNDGMSLFRRDANGLDRPIPITGLRKEEMERLPEGEIKVFKITF
jgi:hypothetical protein